MCVLQHVFSLDIETISRSAQQNAELAGRTKVNIYDLKLALEKLKQPVDWRDLGKIATDRDWEIELGMEIPPFPVHQPTQINMQSIKRRKTGGTSSDSSHAHASHIPVFMPPLPERHTYCNTKCDAVERERDRKTIGERRLEQKRQAQNSLSKMQRHSVYQQHRQSLFGSTSGDSARQASLAANPFIMTPIKVENNAQQSNNEDQKMEPSAKKHLDLFGPPSQPLHPSSISSELEPETSTLNPTDIAGMDKNAKILRGLYHDEEENM